jgi:eukaryotic-like serine/threonine-protein kinase
MLVGGIHAGAEANTITLVEELVAHFQRTPDDLLPGITLLLVPELNPDGAAYGRVNRGRFNGNGVDLNRNWGCDWQATAYFRDTEVYPGDRPFSEPETTALGALINDTRPVAVLFYHAAADGIYAGECDDHSVSQAVAAVVGEATGYPYSGQFVQYDVTGDAANWVDSIGIPAVDVELASDTASEFTRNLRGVMALQCWLIGPDAAAVFVACNE